MKRVNDDVRLWKRHVDGEALVRVFRELHTIKGNARSLGLATISSHTHDVEDVVHELRGVDAADPRANAETTEHAAAAAELEDAIAGLSELLTTYTAVADETLRGGDETQTKANAIKFGRRLEALAARGQTESADLRALAQLVADEADDEVVSVGALFEQHEPLVVDIAGRLGKDVEFGSDPNADFYVDAAKARMLRDAMNHAIRNALDHGIETMEERHASGKTAVGRIWTEVHRTPTGYVLELHDDGRGVDFDALRRRGREKGVIAANADPSEAELLEVLFHPGFSTRAVVTDVSGRGVGLDAIRASVHEAGGSVELRTAGGKGTVLSISLPIRAVRYAESGGRISRPSGPGRSQTHRRVANG